MENFDINTNWIGLNNKIESMSANLSNQEKKIDEINSEIRDLEKEIVEFKVSSITKEDLREFSLKTNESFVNFSQDLKETVLKLNIAIDSLKDGLDVKFNDPKVGIHLRLQALESWKETASKVIWILVGTSVGLAAAVLKKFVLG